MTGTEFPQLYMRKRKNTAPSPPSSPNPTTSVPTVAKLAIVLVLATSAVIMMFSMSRLTLAGTPAPTRRVFSDISVYSKHCHASYPNLVDFMLISKRSTGTRDSQLLTFEAVEDHNFGSLTIPQGVKLPLHDTGKVKSYSPVNLPTASKDGTMELLVKPYSPVPGGGFGHHLCSLEVGDVQPLIIKPDRVVHGSTVTAGRWGFVNLIGGGTGIAPLVQIARAQLEEGGSVRVLSVNKGDDVLMQEELDGMAEEHGERFKVRYLDTSREGRGDAKLAREALHLEGDDFQVFVCGQDGFVDHWAGGIERDENNKKVQGRVRGVLGELKIAESNVYKF